jgi:methylenetetrahydrofolate dehydrogenase (NADP+)/methenyltetrahydrofolate cyclohydrolase
MTAERIDGKLFAEDLRAKTTLVVAKLKKEHGITPGLGVILVGEDPASEVYVRNKHTQTKEAGMNSFEIKLPADTTEETLLAKVKELNENPEVHGFLVQLPLPDQISEAAVIDAIDPAKDVDGFHVINSGRLATGMDGNVPCTPAGCLLLLQDRLGDLSGLDAVVIGRSNIVGKPVASLLTKASCTVTIAHSRTKNLEEVVARADIVVAAVGRPEMVKGDWIKPGATVIDVGVNRIPAPERGEGKVRLVGDVDYAGAAINAAAITPVPGGVGPMTIAMLIRAAAIAAHRQNGLADPDI